VDAIPPTDKAAKTGRPFSLLCFMYPPSPARQLCAAAWRCRQGDPDNAGASDEETSSGVDAAGRRRPNCRAGLRRNAFCPTKELPRQGGTDAQNSPCSRPEKNEIGPRSALYAGLIMY
jgi:hypothetical protein